jgi:dolichyl-phosphate beta-glucosyltransferase
MSNPKVSLILPCYNEMEHIADSLAKIQKMLDFSLAEEEYEIILVDDCSTDGTYAWLKNQDQKNRRIYQNTANLGRGETVRAGLKEARGTVSGFMDIDCEVAETYLPKFILSIRDGNDFAVARRIYRLSPHPYVLVRHVLSVFYRALLNYFLRIHVLDTEAGYKFFSERAKELIINKSVFKGWFWDTEVCALMEMHGLKIIEIPAVFTRNPYKTSTVKVLRDSVKYLSSLGQFLKLRARGHYHIVKANG